MEKEKRQETVTCFKQELERFREDMNQLLKNSSLSLREDFLSRIAKDVNDLYSSARYICDSNNKEMEEVGSIIQNIFAKPLKTGVTFIKAAKEYPQQRGGRSDLSEVVRQYIKCPETTKLFARELELLTEDVADVLEAIA